MTIYFIGLGLLKILITAAFIVGVYKIVTKLSVNIKEHTGNAAAITLLKERYVKNEITKEEYEEKLDVLK